LGIVLVAFHEIVDVAHHGEIGHGKLVLVAFPGEYAHLQDGHVGGGPGLAGAVEEMSRQTGTEKCHAITHLDGPVTAVYRQDLVMTDSLQGFHYIPGEHLILSRRFDGLCRQEDGIADEQPIGPSHAGILSLVTPGDHDPGGDLHLAQHIVATALVFRFVIFFCQGLGVFSEVIPALILQHPQGIAEGWQTHIRIGIQGHLVDLQAMCLKVLPQQGEGTARLDDEDSWSAHRRHLLQQVDQQG
jgi:hypothetical protein